MLMCTLFEGGGERERFEKVFVLYTHLNVDSYAWPLKASAVWKSSSISLVKLHVGYDDFMLIYIYV